MNSNFIHLHTHSHYSLLDGLSKIPNMVKTAKENGMKAIALTDHGNMYGAIELYKECKKVGIKPIIGVEAYIAERGREDKEAGVDNKRYHLTLLAKNRKGYKNLMHLVTLANLEGYYYKPRMDHEILRKYSEGIICLSGCMASKLSRAILAEDNEKAEALIKEHQDIFGKENYFLEVHAHPKVENDKKLRDGILALSKKFNIPTVAGQDSHYLCKEDHKAHNTLLAVNTGNNSKEGTRFEFSDDDFSLIDEKTARSYFKDTPESIDNTVMVADLCEDYDLELGTAFFPDFPIPENKTADEVLRGIVYEGFKSRKLEQTKVYIDRLEYELGIIKQKGYPTYFLVVADLINHARKNGILTNIRGSVAVGAFCCISQTSVKEIVDKAKEDLNLPIRDSKKLTKIMRDKWFRYLNQCKKEGLCSFSVSFVASDMIDKFGIIKSIKKSLEKSLVESLGKSLVKSEIIDKKEVFVYLDGGLSAPEEYINQETIIKGDENNPVISLASIVAKVSRDKVMTNYSKEYPEYGFEKHVGYGTKAHYQAIKKYGQTSIHRKSFIHR